MPGALRRRRERARVHARDARRPVRHRRAAARAVPHRDGERPPRGAAPRGRRRRRRGAPAITAELRGGGDEPSLSIGRVARRLGATPRSLQRRLRAEGVSYRELVDAVRHRRAIELVQRGIPSHDIADQLGFSEPRAFRRAFRRWTGILPSALRRA
ncbi:MAG: helix-turn-helix domain-containing protein [Deltaproteobacteria bacterium]|nr:helix-turn-helix domain-containing protein [Deltaproteobacteria bacterium]